MIYGVFSDIHGNLHALDAVLKHLDKLGVEHYLCCGDLVGYGPKPDECIRRVSKLKNLLCVLGNHDSAVLGQTPLDEFTAYAASTIEYARGVLSAESENFLAKCPQVTKEKKFTLVHGSPKEPLSEYLTMGEQFLESLNFFDTQVCFVGHTHIPVFFKQKGIQFPESRMLSEKEKILIESSSRYIINPGSVGQSRDGNPQASFGVYNSTENTFEVFRLDYPYKKTQKEMQGLKFPPYLIERLSKGL